MDGHWKKNQNNRGAGRAEFHKLYARAAHWQQTSWNQSEIKSIEIADDVYVHLNIWASLVAQARYGHQLCRLELLEVRCRVCRFAATVFLAFHDVTKTWPTMVAARTRSSAAATMKLSVSSSTALTMLDEIVGPMVSLKHSVRISRKIRYSWPSRPPLCFKKNTRSLIVQYPSDQAEFHKDAVKPYVLTLEGNPAALPTKKKRGLFK